MKPFKITKKRNETLHKTYSAKLMHEKKASKRRKKVKAFLIYFKKMEKIMLYLICFRIASAAA